jgi:hypothetical protein
VNIHLLQGIECYEFEVSNSQGQVIQKGCLFEGTNNLNISAHPAGCYFLRVLGKDQVYIKTFIKK